MPRILIADDSAIARKTLASLLAETKEWTLCGEATNGCQAVLLAYQLKPDLIILDIAMPMLDGFQAAAEILRATPETPILFYTLHGSDEIALAGEKRVRARSPRKATPARS